jgi:hypothetical protein
MVSKVTTSWTGFDSRRRQGSFLPHTVFTLHDLRSVSSDWYSFPGSKAAEA